MIKWVILIYDIPNKPSSKRLYVWRKLKRIGALSLQDAVFVLPYTDKTLEQMQWIAAEISEMDGKADVFVSVNTSEKQDEEMKQRILAGVKPKYQDIIDQLSSIELSDRSGCENMLKKCIRLYLDVKYYDYLHCELSEQVEACITKIQNEMKDHAYGKRDER